MGEKATKKFRIDTETIPDEVDVELATERNALIAHWRAGQAPPEATLRSLFDLYWRTQKHTNETTNVYLILSACQFPLEAGLPIAEVDRIYNEALHAADLSK
ncbi:MAG: hypothetical protein JWS12_313 [Candidatus Saccharibacteria bacterium]|nr:hypothetical protein [Candidatus Saccharibacteria bacterium]